jgi:hypothetical protein
MRIVLIGLGLFLITLRACSDPLDGFTLTYKIPISEGLYRFQPRNYDGKLPANIRYSIMGKNYLDIVNGLGDKKISFNKDGVLVLAIPTSLVPSMQNPFQFNVGFGALDHLQKVYNLSKDNKSNGNFNPLLAPYKKTINGVYGDSLNSTQGLSKTLINEKGDTLAKLNLVSSGTWGASWNMQMSQFNRSGSRYIPAGGRISQYRNLQGQVVINAKELIFVESMLQLQVFDKDLFLTKNATNEINSTMYLENSINRAKGNVWTKTDSLELFRYDEEGSYWEFHGFRPVEKRGSNYVVNAKITKTGIWILSSSKQLCASGPKISINSAFTDLDLYYLYQVIDEKNQLLRSGYMSINKNSEINLTYFDANTGKIKFKLLNYTDTGLGDINAPLFETNFINACTSVSLKAEVEIKPKPEAVVVELKLKCPTGTSLPNELKRTQIRLQVSEPNKKVWRELLTFTFENPILKSYRVERGKTYDLRISTDGGNTYPYIQEAYTIKYQSFRVNLNAEGYCK